MSDDVLLQAASQLVFLLIFLLTLINFLRNRDRAALEILGLFTCLAVIILLSGFTKLTGFSSPILTLIATFLLLAQPYLLLRLVTHFRPLPRIQHVIGLAYLAISWGLIGYMTALQQKQLPPPLTLVLVISFAYVEGYAGFSFIASALNSRGVTRRRLIAAATGSLFLTADILLAGVMSFVPDWASNSKLLADVLGLGTALGYYVGFAPPRWLRRSWQLVEFRAFVAGLSGHSAEDRFSEALGRLGGAAARAVGAKAGFVALGEPPAVKLAIYRDMDFGAALHAAGIASIELTPANPGLSSVWTERQLLTWHKHWASSHGTDIWGPEMRRLSQAFGGAKAAVVSPLLAHDRLFGLLIILFENSSAFLDDEIELIRDMSEQAALAIEGARLFDDARRHAAERQSLLELSQSLSEPMSEAEVGSRLLHQVDKLLPATASALALPAAGEGLEVAVAAGVNADAHVGRHLEGQDSPACQSFQSGDLIVANDVADSSRYSFLSEPVRSELAVPLRHHHETLGVLVLLSTSPNAFGPDEVALAKLVAADAALSLARAQLLERLRQQNVALEEASRMKSEFLANMSHELRTPLNAILGFSELLIDDPDQQADRETALQYLDRIHDSGTHLLAVINDILDLSKVEAGRMELHREVFAVDALIESVLETVRPLADRKTIQLTADLEPAVTLYADMGKVKQILYNLLSNAIKFTPEEGEVRVECRAAEDRVELSVADNGIGIDPAHHERVFQEFQQVDGGADRHYEGTGLGLALTKRFVELHNGRIWLESERGQGSRFHVALPVVEPRAAEESLSEMTAMARALTVPGSDEQPLVLVIEDNPSGAQLMSVYLTRAGYRVEVVGNGRDALARARELSPAAITLDIMLPDLDGWQVLRDLKADPSTREIPVIVASIVDNKPLGYALGATDYLVKPIERETLLSKMARYTTMQGGEDDADETTVLVVDDDLHALELMSQTLAPLHFTILQARSGAEGIAIAQQRHPHIMLLDLMMPNMNGFEVVATMRTDPVTRHIPILVVTAKDLSNEERATLNGGVAGVFQKGNLGQADLVGAVNSILQDSRGREGVSRVAS